MTRVSSGNSDRRQRYGEETSLEKEGLGEVQLEKIPCSRMRVCVSMSLGCRMSTVSPKCEKVCADDRFLHIGDDEDPWQRAAETEVECEGSLSVRAYGCIVYGV